jgi:DNA-binding CsgD family transcriptional regulator
MDAGALKPDSGVAPDWNLLGHRHGANAMTPNADQIANEHLKGNGQTEVPQANLTIILAGLQTMRDGDFSVRLPGHWTGLAGEVADTFNETVSANQQIAEELKRVGQAVGKEGRTREHANFFVSRGAWGEMEVSVNTLVEDLLRPTNCAKPAKALGGEQLTSRQREIVQLLAEGKTSKEVSTLLNLSVKTVGTHRANIMKRFSCHSVSDLVRYAVRNNIIQA